MQENNLQDYFSVRLAPLKCSLEVKSYIISTLCKYKGNEYDLSQDSVGILFVQAREQHKFELYQNLGDWIFFCQTILHGSLRFASEDYYHTIAQSSYSACYFLINKQWELFKELSDNLIAIEKQTKKLIRS